MTKPVTGRRSLGLYLWAAGLLGWVGLAMADVWDPADDSQFLTASNELVHGSEQIHELGPGMGPGGRDFDFYRMGERPLASYEVVVDGVTNDISAFLSVQRWNASGPVQQAQATSSAFGSRSLRWQNTINSSLATSWVRVGASSPCVGCTSAKAAYHIRSYETTYSVPRFNNSATQTTLLMVQNTSDREVNGGAHFWSSAGALLGTQPFTLSSKQLLVQNTAGLVFAAGTSGSVTVSHDGRYGDLAGKAVALEPATGFTFETALTPRPR